MIARSHSRRHFLLAAGAATATSVSWRAVGSEQQEARAAAAGSNDAASAGSATFQEVWETVRDRFYDPRLHGLDWPAVRDRYSTDAATAASSGELAEIINRMLSELKASHSRYFTSEEPEYYQLADIFTGALRRRGLNCAFPGGRISYPGIGILSRIGAESRGLVTGVVESMPAYRAGLLAGDEIISADGAPFQPVGSFRGKVGKPVVLTLRRAGATMQVTVTPDDIEPNKMFLDGLQASARVVQANGRRIGYVHVWSYAGYGYQRALENLIAQGTLRDADALIWDLRDGWGGAIPEDPGPVQHTVTDDGGDQSRRRPRVRERQVAQTRCDADQWRHPQRQGDPRIRLQEVWSGRGHRDAHRGCGAGGDRISDR